MRKNSGALPRPEAQAGNIQFTLTRPAEALRLAEEIRIPQDIADAQTLLDWFAARSMRQVAAVDIQKRGPVHCAGKTGWTRPSRFSSRRILNQFAQPAMGVAQGFGEDRARPNPHWTDRSVRLIFTLDRFAPGSQSGLECCSNVAGCGCAGRCWFSGFTTTLAAR
jgi:hypothetical protein